MENRSTLKILKENYKVVARLFKYSRGFRKSYIAALIINAFTMVRFSFIIGFSIQWVTDSAIARDWVQVENSLTFAVIAFVINSILYFFEGYLMLTRVEMMMAKVKNELCDKVLHLSAQYYDSNHSGDLQSRLTSDLALAGNAISFTLVDPINFIALGIANLIFIGLSSWKMAIICVILVALVIILNSVFIKRIQQSSEKIQSAIATATECFSDIINGIAIIKIFNLQQWIYNRYDNESKKVLYGQSRLIKMTSAQKSLNNLVNNVCNFVVLGIGAIFLSQGELTAGALLAIFRYVSTLVFAFTGFGMVLSEITESIVGAKRVLEILDLQEENQSNYRIKPNLSDRIVLAFENVSFKYENGQRVIENFSEKIQKGEKIALAGPSGAGKSTILSLIMGFYEPSNEDGKIILYGKDIREYSLEERRRLMTYVPQSNYLFSGTIRENIAFGREGATDEDVVEAAKAAYAHDFIIKQPQGYDTKVGERGVFLSGGEKQRIAIARALLKDAPIILLDEATASLDSESEREVQTALEVLMEGKTVIAVAHRLSTVKDADRIIVLNSI